MSGETLLDRCLAAHGGLDRWRQFGAIDVDLTTWGLVFATHGQPPLRTMARVATREPLVILSPYRRWPRGVFQRDRVFIEDAAGRVIAERKNPRARMGRGRRLLWWDALDTLYFVGYALSNYVRAPFMFAQNGFNVLSAGAATLGRGTWSTLRISFPLDEPTHCATHLYYLDAAHLIQRVDYVAEPIGRWARAAHFCADYRESGGLRAPARRWVVPRTRGDRAVSWPPLVQIRITAVRPISHELIADGPYTDPSEGRGAIVFLPASLTGQFIPYMSGITAACAGVEKLSRTLATEPGPAGVRVNCVRAGGMPETRTIGETTANMAATMGVERDEAARSTSTNVLRRPLRVEETAATVAWVASDMASGVAGQVVNVCAGAIVSR